MTKKPPLKLLVLSCPIWEELALEEALFRADPSNWCLITTESPPAIVMGLSQDQNVFVDLEEASHQNLPLIRRCSGGGTVVVDEETLFFSLICNDQAAACEKYPKSILAWTYNLLAPAFSPVPFSLQDTDFAIFDKKIGGNAQAFMKNRLLNHTSFLWSWEIHRMKALKHPPKEPLWRNKRSHEDFLGKLKDFFPTKEHVIEQMIASLSHSFDVTNTSIEEAKEIQKRPHRTALRLYHP